MNVVLQLKNSMSDIKEGDIIEAFEMVEIEDKT